MQLPGLSVPKVELLSRKSKSGHAKVEDLACLAFQLSEGVTYTSKQMRARGLDRVLLTTFSSASAIETLVDCPDLKES